MTPRKGCSPSCDVIGAYAVHSGPCDTRARLQWQDPGRWEMFDGGGADDDEVPEGVELADDAVLDAPLGLRPVARDEDEPDARLDELGWALTCAAWRAEHARPAREEEEEPHAAE